MDANIQTEQSKVFKLPSSFAYNLRKADPQNQIKLIEEVNRYNIKKKPEEFKALAHELQLDKLIHFEKDGKTKYFEIEPGTFNLIQLCEDLSNQPTTNNRENNPAPANFLFENIIFGLQDPEDIKIIMENVLKAGNLPTLQYFWRKYGYNTLNAFKQTTSYSEKADWAISTFFPNGSPTTNPWK